MDMTPKEYQDYVAQKQQPSPIVKDTILAFLIGGTICTLGQLIQTGWGALGLAQEDAGMMTSVTLVFLSISLTALNLYNKIARFGGAGTLVPITGFANAVASPSSYRHHERRQSQRASCLRRGTHTAYRLVDSDLYCSYLEFLRQSFHDQLRHVGLLLRLSLSSELLDPCLLLSQVSLAPDHLDLLQVLQYTRYVLHTLWIYEKI